MSAAYVLALTAASCEVGGWSDTTEGWVSSARWEGVFPANWSKGWASPATWEGRKQYSPANKREGWSHSCHLGEGRRGDLTWGDVQAPSPLSDLGVLELPELLGVLQHHRGALVGHAKLVGVHRHAGHPPHAEVKRGDGVPQLASKGQDEAS